MTEQAVDQKVVDRIHKLLALSQDGGATEAEAALAAERVGDLMRKHNLSMATLEAQGGSAGQEGRRVDARTSKRAMYKWQQRLMTAVAMVNFCHVDVVMSRNVRIDGSVSSKLSPQGYRLIGRESNVVAARELFDYLIDSITRILMEQELSGDGGQAHSRRAESFREGCSDRLQERLRERHVAALAEQARQAAAQRAQTQARPGEANALVVVLAEYASTEDDLNYDHLAGRAPGTTARQRAERLARLNAYEAGIVAKAAALRAADPTMDEQVADYLARGWCDTREEAEIRLGLRSDPKAKVETDRQRERREERESRERYRAWRRWTKHSARRDHDAYGRGSQAGDGIGLEKQVTSTDKGRLT